MISIKIFKNIWLYIFFGLFILVGNLVLHGNVLSFGSLGKWTFYQNVKVGSGNIKKSLIDDTAIGTTLANIKLGKGDISKYYFLNKALEYMTRCETLVNTDVVELLEMSENKAAVLESHLKQMQELSNNIGITLVSINEIAIDKKSESQNCKTNKSDADTIFFQGFNTNDEGIMVEGLTSSLKNGPCYVENRIISNAYFAVYDKLVFYNKILDGKLNLLELNQDLILQNFKLFKDKYLEDLISIRDNLNRFKIGSEDF